MLDKVVGLRVTHEEEIEGLDIVGHGASAYPGDVYGGTPSDDVAPVGTFVP